jgi:hypothetical protein
MAKFSKMSFGQKKTMNFLKVVVVVLGACLLAYGIMRWLSFKEGNVDQEATSTSSHQSGCYETSPGNFTCYGSDD